MSRQSTGASPWEKGGTNCALRPRVVSIDDAAAYIGRSRSFVYDLLGLGIVRAVKSDGRTLPIVSDLDAYLDSLPFAEVRPAHPEKLKKESAP
jgi:hypothetical protein